MKVNSQTQNFNNVNISIPWLLNADPIGFNEISQNFQ